MKPYLTILLLALCLSATAQSPPTAVSAVSGADSRAAPGSGNAVVPTHGGATQRPASVAPRSYQVAQGNRTEPATACSSARLKPDGLPGCGMSGLWARRRDSGN
jgi:hypothetical protein